MDHKILGSLVLFKERSLSKSGHNEVLKDLFVIIFIASAVNMCKTLVISCVFLNNIYIG